jgi:hypothetical protein
MFATNYQQLHSAMAIILNNSLFDPINLITLIVVDL